MASTEMGSIDDSKKDAMHTTEAGHAGQPLSKRQRIEIMKSTIKPDNNKAVVKLKEDNDLQDHAEMDFSTDMKDDDESNNSANDNCTDFTKKIKDDSCSIPTETFVQLLDCPTNPLLTSKVSNIFSNNQETTLAAVDEVDRAIGITNPMYTAKALQMELSKSKTTHTDNMLEFEQSLAKQCLCGVPERKLQKPFQSHYSVDINGQQRIANISEWPSDKIIQLLSNLQLLFDIYLKQNSKGFICLRIMDLCDAIIRNDHHLIDEIISLSNYKNHYVRYLASKAISAFLVIAKQDLKENWLEEIIDNSINPTQLSEYNVQKTNFSLGIIRRIVEWKDVELHPLEDKQANPAEEASTLSDNAAAADLHTHGHILFETQQPSLENNYFAVYFNSDDLSDCEEAEQAPSDESKVANTTQRNMQPPISAPSFLPADCQFHALTDSESFDTAQLKSIIIKRLANKWPVLLQNISMFISVHIDYAEDCIINFLNLWESITSVKANLPVSETLPFYARMDKFVRLLFTNTPNSIYKQMLCLFNEALCYGSTLALQDVLPEEPCELARIVVKYAKDGKLFEDLPRGMPQNIVGLIGFKNRTIAYEHEALQSSISTKEDNVDTKMDRTILQKIVLLVLKSVAIIVKEIRSDSSDSSIDSTDYDALQDMKMIVRLISEAINKLEAFMKSKLDFHSQSHFSKVLVHLFKDQDDYLIEALVCTLDVATGISLPNGVNDELVSKLNPAYSFIEFIKLNNDSDWLLDYLVDSETCFLLYLLRILKYITSKWSNFELCCQQIGLGPNTLDEVMFILKKLQDTIQTLVTRQLFPYNIDPILSLLKKCTSLHERNPL